MENLQIDVEVANLAVKMYCDIYNHLLSLRLYQSDRTDLIERCEKRAHDLMQGWERKNVAEELEAMKEGLAFASGSKMKDYVFGMIQICIEYEKGRKN